MITMKNIVIAFMVFFTTIGYAQDFDMYLNDDDEMMEELKDITPGAFMTGIIEILKKGEAEIGGNWMSSSLELMIDPRFGSAPKEYNNAYIVRTKVIKLLTFQAILDQMDLSCLDTKRTLESFIMFLGTIYLDIFAMDYFNETDQLEANEYYNIGLGIIDAAEKFETGAITRSNLYGFGETACYNDVKDTEVTDCDCELSFDEEKRKEKYAEMMQLLGLEKLHPGNILAITKNVQSRLNSLPCND